MDKRACYKTLRAIWSAALTLILLGVGGGLGDPALAQAASQSASTTLQLAQIEQALQTDGSARVVVALRQPYATSAVARKAQMAQAQSRVIEALSATQDFQVVHRYQTVPGLVGVATSQGLENLRRHPDVQAVALDMQIHASLTESAAVIRANRVWNDLGITGAGINVAVLDSGVDLNHPDLVDHIVAQHCFSKGDCPPGKTDEGESAQDEHGHGTHVAGIITSRGTVSPRGIAPDAGIVAVRVMNETGSGWNSDIVAGLDWVVANQASLNVKVVNMSLGAGLYSGACNTQDANTLIEAAAVDAARRAGIVVMAASGNDGQTDAMAAPACISGVVSVGGTYDANFGSVSWPTCTDANATTDQVACFSNSSPLLDLLAPGAVIVSTALGGGQVGKSGTSMATPHVAAVAALMLQAYPSLTPTEIETALKNTGAPIRDQRNGRVTPRVDALAAVTRVISDHITTSVSVAPSNVRVTVDATATTTLQANAISNLYSVTLRLTFDPNIVQVVDADPGTPNVQIAVGALMSGRDYTVTRNEVDNTTGVVEFALSLRGAALPITGSGPVAVITWQGKGVGQSALTLQQSRLAHPDGGPILHNIRNGAVQVQPSIISGVVLLQGRTNHGGTTVYLTRESCPLTPQPTQVITAGLPSAATDAQGHFEIAIASGGNYFCLQAVRLGYLVGQKGAPQGYVGTITLLGGDVMSDDKIDIFDLSRVAARYGSHDPEADVNGDGVVDIFDLTLVASNFGQSGPVVSWR
jgi:subtilisin family serine protease